MNILVVDDEKEIADVIELYLQNDQYNVFKFYTGQEALDFLKSTKVDLAILDIMLPDVDGFQIRTLILTMLYRLAPTLIRDGYVYIAESPLYEIVSKGKTYFAYSDREKAAIVDSLGGAKADISRSKGLGENDPEMMWLTTMNPDTRKLIRVMPEDVERTAQVFDLLLGDNLAGRKAHIAECGSQFLDLADIS